MLSLLLATALLAPAEAPPTANAFDVLILTTVVLDDPGLPKELGLSHDQLKALKEHRDKWVAEYDGLPPVKAAEKRGEFNEANEQALAKILSDKQLLLLRRRLLWEACRLFGEFQTLRYPSVSKELDLSEQQMAKLKRGELAADVLSADQKKKWDEMRGPRPSRWLKVALTGYSSSLEKFRWRDPVRLMLLVLPAVQDELKLTDKQKAVVQEQCTKWSEDGAAHKEKEKHEALVDAVEKSVADALDERQNKRLAQLQRQQACSPRVGQFWASAFHVHSFRHDVGLSGDQENKVEQLDLAYVADIAKMKAKTETAEELVKLVRPRAAAYQEALRAILDTDQKKKADELYGEILDRRLPRVSPGRWTEGPYAQLPPLLILVPEMSGLALSKEFDLSEGIRKELARLDTEVQGVPSRMPDPLSQQRAYATLVTRLEKVLGEKRYRRASEVLLQMLEDPPEGMIKYNARGVAEWPEMIAALKLSEEQVDRIRDGYAIVDVLDEGQMRQLEQLRGAPAKDLPRVRRDIDPSARDMYPENLLIQPAVVAELKLSDEQQKQVTTWADEMHEFGLRCLFVIHRDDKARKQLSERLDAILTAGQRARLRQIERQIWTATDDGVIDLLDDKVAFEEVAPTREEKGKLVNLYRQRKHVYECLTPYLDGPRRNGGGGFWDIMREVYAADTTRAEKLLGTATAKRLNNVLGERFDGVSYRQWGAPFTEIQRGLQIVIRSGIAPP